MCYDHNMLFTAALSGSTLLITENILNLMDDTSIVTIHSIGVNGSTSSHNEYLLLKETALPKSLIGKIRL